MATPNCILRGKTKSMDIADRNSYFENGMNILHEMEVFFSCVFNCTNFEKLRLPRDRSRCAPQRIWRLSVGTRHQYININTRRNRYINVGQRCRVSYHPCITTGKMEFLSFDVKNYTLELRKADVPNPGPNDVRIRVAYSGICGTDLHILEGSFPCKKDGFLTLGHEFAGTVDAIGSSVKNFKVGQRVAVDPNSGCNTCNYCHDGSYQHCTAGGINSTIGIYKDGGFSTHAIVPESQVYLIPDDVELHQAVLVEPLSCLAHGWKKLNSVNVGSNVLVIGAGIIGLLWACMLHLHGLRKSVTISEPQEKRRKLVTKLDLDFEAKSPEQLKNSYDVVVDCSGSAPAIEASIPLLAPGGRLCIFGVANPKAKFSIEPFQVYLKELTILGVNINPFSFPRGLGLLRAMADRYLNYDKLGIKVFSLSQYREALEALKRGEISKAVFKL